MKKLVYVTIALVALFAANSCKNKNNVPVISAADSVEVEDAMNDSTIMVYAVREPLCITWS